MVFVVRYELSLYKIWLVHPIVKYINKYTVSHNTCICIVIYYKCIGVSASFGHHIYIYIYIYIYI